MALEIPFQHPPPPASSTLPGTLVMKKVDTNWGIEIPHQISITDCGSQWQNVIARQCPRKRQELKLEGIQPAAESVRSVWRRG